MAIIPHPARRRAAATSSIPCQAMTAAKRATPTARPPYAARDRRILRMACIGVGYADHPRWGSTWGFIVRSSLQAGTLPAYRRDAFAMRKPRSQIGPGNRWAAARTWSKALMNRSASVWSKTRGGISLMMSLP